MSEELTVLVVDDEKQVAEAYALWLRDEYDVRTAYGGEEALEAVDDDVDVVLLDRRMGRVSGDEVLERIREKGHDCRVAMVTAVGPDFDIVEMPFDEYLTKPVTRQELVEAIEELATLDEYTESVREQFRLAKIRATLEARKSAEELTESEEYRELCDRLEELEAETTATIEEMGEDTFRAALSDLPGCDCG